jgi:hypothetical protein
MSHPPAATMALISLNLSALANTVPKTFLHIPAKISGVIVMGRERVVSFPPITVIFFGKKQNFYTGFMMCLM